jgi:hypothetical protein
MTISLNQQIEEIERELILRRRVYPRLVTARQMRASVADYHMQRLEAVLDTLTTLRDKETGKDAK